MKINKLLVAGLLALTGVATGVAQQVQWGVKAGYNLSSLSGAPEGSDVQFRSGFHVGGLAEFRLTDKLGLQPELLYSTEGAKSTFTFDGGELVINAREEVKLSYLNLPVMLTYDVAGGLSLQAGPQLGYLLSAESDYDYSTNFLGEPFSESGTDDLMDEANKIALGLNLGLGYEFTNNLFLQARYHLGLSSIADRETSDDEPGVDMNDIRNSGFQFSVGYKF